MREAEEETISGRNEGAARDTGSGGDQGVADGVPESAATVYSVTRLCSDYSFEHGVVCDLGYGHNEAHEARIVWGDDDDSQE
jgi:hypothetical protein